MSTENAPVKKSLTDEEYKKILASCVDCSSQYCFFRAFLEHQHPSERLIFQLKCVEIFKFLRSKELGYDIGWHGAAEAWVAEGYAHAFSKAYDVYLAPMEVYRKTEDLVKATKIIQEAENKAVDKPS